MQRPTKTTTKEAMASEIAAPAKQEIDPDSQSPSEKSLLQRLKNSWQRLHALIHEKSTLGQGGRRLFWAWIAYQTIKGSLTTAFIWIPLIYLWLKNTP